MIDLIGLLESHAQEAVEANPANAFYAVRVRENAVRAGELIATRSGEIRSVVSTWRSGFRPIAETVFGITLELRETDTLPTTYAEFTPTALGGILGRVSRLSDDEIMGPLLSLDLRGAGAA